MPVSHSSNTQTTPRGFFGIIQRFPLFAILLVAFNIFVFTKPEVVSPASASSLLFEVTLISGAIWRVEVLDIFVILGVLTLYIELVKSTKSNMASILEHVFSLIIAIAFLLEFLLVKGCGSSAFFVLTLLSFLDVIAGFTISISTARRDWNVPGAM